jgi:hypothetical protein
MKPANRPGTARVPTCGNKRFDYASTAGAPGAQQTPTTEQNEVRIRWVRFTPQDHAHKQIKVQRKLVEDFRTQFKKEKQAPEGMEKAKAFFPQDHQKLACGQTIDGLEEIWDCDCNG